MRRTSARRSIFALAAVLALGISTAYAEEDVVPDPEGDVELVAAEEFAYMGIGCQREGDAPTCDSTELWLGHEHGESSVGNAGTITPLNHVFDLTGEEPLSFDFTGDSSLAPFYTLRTDEPIAGQVSLRGHSGTDTSVDAKVRIDMSFVRSDTNRRVFLPTVESSKVAMTLGDNAFPFEIELPENLEGVDVRGLSLTVTPLGIHAGTSGFMDGEGGSFLTIPHWAEGSVDEFGTD